MKGVKFVPTPMSILTPGAITPIELTPTPSNITPAARITPQKIISPDHQDHQYKAKEQSQYTKENLYNLDSDDDELDFLRKDFDFEERD